MTHPFWRWYLVWVVVVGGACTVAAAQKKSEHIYDTSFGSVLCAESNTGPCGITLWNCHDGATYFCMLNVRERGE